MKRKNNPPTATEWAKSSVTRNLAKEFQTLLKEKPLFSNFHYPKTGYSMIQSFNEAIQFEETTNVEFYFSFINF